MRKIFPAAMLLCLAAISPATAQNQPYPTSIPPDVVYYDRNQTFTASQRGDPLTVSPVAGVITLNFDTRQNFIVLLDNTCPCTLANPTGTITPVQTAQIFFVQDATGGRTITATGTFWIAAGGAAGGLSTLTTSANAIDVFSYAVYSSTKIAIGPGVLNATH